MAKLLEQHALRGQLTIGLMGNMAHELRAPLNSVLGFSRLIARDDSLSAKHRQQLNIIRRNGEHLLHLIDDILDLSRIEAGRTRLNLVEFDFCRFLDDVILLVIDDAHSRNLRFLPLIDDSVRGLWLSGDKGKLRQILLNLLGNAIKYTKAQHVTLGVRAENGGAAAALCIDVEDSGPAIPADKLGAIFNAFERVDAAASAKIGTGLGLTITKSLVELMGGSISVANTAGGGNRFTVVLPACWVPASLQGDDEETQCVPQYLSDGQHEFRVLVVDDDDDHRNLLATLLRELGFSVLEARNGAEAIRVFRLWLPHFVWMDLQLPDMNGRYVAQHLRRLPGGGDAKIAALTSNLLAHNPEGAVDADFDDCLNKPFREEHLLAAMQHLLQLHFDYRDLAVDRKVYVQLASDDFQGLTSTLLKRMLVAVDQSHNENMHRLIDEVPEEKRELAYALRLLVDTCEWGHLEQILGSALDQQTQGLINPN